MEVWLFYNKKNPILFINSNIVGLIDFPYNFKVFNRYYGLNNDKLKYDTKLTS